MVVQACRAFKAGACRYGAACKYEHIDTSSPVSHSWQVSGLPPTVCESAVEEAFRSSFSISTGTCTIDLRNRAGNASKPYAFLEFQPESHSDGFDHTNLLERRLSVSGFDCQLKPRRQPREARRAAQAAADRVSSDRLQAKRDKALSEPSWTPNLLAKFPMRHSCLCKHAMVAQLPADLLHLLVDQYLPLRLPGHHGAIIRQALQAIWQSNPTSVRVKELFETVESFVSISKQIRIWLERNPQGSTVFDLACGHGLLGVMLAAQFPYLRVVCVDLVERDGFETYRHAFASLQTLGDARSGCSYHKQRADGFVCAQMPTVTGQATNLEFVEGDMAGVTIPQAQSFVCCVHACNEANQMAVDMAVAACAGFGAMPCCIRNGLYCAKAVGQGDDSRYTLMVGVMAGVYGAHTISSIDRQITNRHFIMYGGY
jgi:hypothetical protein